jgi:SAM-dependent methyltransferase
MPIKGISRGGEMSKGEIKQILKNAYGRFALKQRGLDFCSIESDIHEYVISIGYSKKDLELFPEEANLVHSCGNPIALACLKKGEVVLDLGSGAGFDCFLAANIVGKTGKVIGIDITPEMVKRARANARKNKYKNVEFKLGEIEHLPFKNSSVDAIISNCVINLSFDKQRVLKEAYRVLKPNGRIVVSDIALKKELPKRFQLNIEAYINCISGAIPIDDYTYILEYSGFKRVRSMIKNTSIFDSPHIDDPLDERITNSLDEGDSLKDYVVSIYMAGHK